MSEKLSWSITAGSAGGNIHDSGTLDIQALTTASVTVEAGSEAELEFQLGDVGMIAFVAVKASNYGGKVKVKADVDENEVVLTGPLVLYGSAIKLLGTSLETVTVGNEDTDKDADIEILLGRKLEA